jgi:hypothetical protein
MSNDEHRAFLAKQAEKVSAETLRKFKAACEHLSRLSPDGWEAAEATWEKARQARGEDRATFWLGPNDHPMSQAHDAEAKRRGAEFYNYGWALGEDFVCSKTSKGKLETHWDAQAREWKHEWME